MAEGVVVVDDAGRLVLSNEAAARHLGVPPHDADGVVPLLDRLDALEVCRPAPPGFQGVRDALLAAIHGIASCPWRAVVSDALDARILELVARPVPRPPAPVSERSPRRAALILRDVTREARLEADVREREAAAAGAREVTEAVGPKASAAQLLALVDHLSTAVLFEDAHGRVAFVNRAYHKMFGSAGSPDLAGAADHSSAVVDLGAFLRLRDARKRARAPALADRVELLDRRVLERDYVPVDVAGVVEGHFWCYRDVTERERAREHLAELSNRDELTALYNRRGFVTLAEQWLRLAARTKRTPLLLFVDVNGMKPVNDRLGHAAGDGTLRDTADLLRATFRDSDIVARLGGDEFVVLAVDALPTHASLLSERLQRNVDAFNETSQRPYLVSMSVGTSVWDPAHPRGIGELLAEADARMYEAKRRRRIDEPVRAALGT
jgi:diguanylate cyclase (GGDEF)-like protein